MLQPFGDALWIADGPTVSFFGFPYPTRMAIAQLDDGSLWVWSPIALDDQLREAVAALGPVRHLVAPNKLHHLFLGEWKQAFPEAKLYAPPGLARRRKDLAFDAELTGEPDPAWAGQIEPLIFGGSFAMDEVVFHHRASRSVILCDLLQKLDVSELSSWQRWFLRADDVVGPEGSTPREWRATFVRRSKTRAAARALCAFEPERVVIAHGQCAGEGGSEVLRAGLRWAL